MSFFLDLFLITYYLPSMEGRAKSTGHPKSVWLHAEHREFLRWLRLHKRFETEADALRHVLALCAEAYEEERNGKK